MSEKLLVLCAISLQVRYPSPRPVRSRWRRTINDVTVRFDFPVLRDWSASAFAQHEQWKILLLASGLQKNVTTSVQFSYWPHSGALIWKGSAWANLAFPKLWSVLEIWNCGNGCGLLR